MREQGMTLQAIADVLNAEGVPTLRGGAMWRPSSVQRATGYRRPSSGSRGIELPKRARSNAERAYAASITQGVGSGLSRALDPRAAALEESASCCSRVSPPRSSRSHFRCPSRSARRPRGRAGPARGPQGAADLRRRDGARLRRLEGGARSRGRALRHARGLRRPDPRGDADRRAARGLRRRPRPLPGRDRRQRRPRARGHERRRHDELPVGAHRRRVGDARRSSSARSASAG